MNIGEITEKLIYLKDHAPLSRREIDTINEACNLLDKLPNMLTAISALEEQTEDKRLICDLLTITLQATRNASDLISLRFDSETEIVAAHFIGGGVRIINVACDSGVAMIRDIMQHLGV